MRGRRRAGLLLAAVAALGVGPGPEMVLQEAYVEVAGVSPGGEVLLLGVARIPKGYSTRVVRTDELLLDDDGDGVVRYEPASGVAFKSVWVAVDLASGKGDAAGPEGFGLRPGPPGLVALAGPALAGELRTSRRFLELWLIRPGVGIWHLSGGDGGASDADGAVDGALTLSISAMAPVATTLPPAPEALVAGDRVLAVDPDLLELWQGGVEVAPDGGVALIAGDPR